MIGIEDLLTELVSDAENESCWTLLANWLELHDDPRRADLLQLHRRLLATCCDPDSHPDREIWHSQIVELIEQGVRPCIPDQILLLRGGAEMQFSFIPPGTFVMGNDHRFADDNETPAHRVTVTKGFYLGVHPVTQAQWVALMGTNPSRFRGKNRPVECVSWNDCQQFCQILTSQLKGRAEICLPTEAQWEYACRAGTTTDYFTGNGRAALRKAGWYVGNSRRQTHPVGQMTPNAWNLHDMHGNVWEWVADGFEDYSEDDACDFGGPEDSEYRVIRGGSWSDSRGLCRSSYRYGLTPENRFADLGFRVSLIVPGQ